jgi:formylglycine-generating enzyme required for sulfatase activity/DNA-binding beta-propeller fold protein YncE
MLWSGNFADVYKIYCAATGNTWALKCFTRAIHGRQERYRDVAAQLEAADLPFTVPFVYLERGIQVHGQWFPAVKMQWVEGQTLNRFVEDSLDKPLMLRQLLDLWPKLAARLRDAQIAHADLQHGNVLLVPMPDGKLALKLIDYDGMWIPSLAGEPSGELGHPAYQHPQRQRQGAYNAHLDRFSHLVIYTAVHALAAGHSELWQRFNNDENLLFREGDFPCPERSELFQTLWDGNDADVHALAGHLVLACSGPLDSAVWLNEIVRGGRVAPLTRGQEKKVSTGMAAGNAAARAIHPAAPLPEETPTAAPESTVPSGTRPATPTGTVPVAQRLHRPGEPAAYPAWRAFRSIDFLFRRMAGAENEIHRYFLWALSVVLLLVAVWFGTGAALRALTALLAKPPVQEPAAVESANDSRAPLKIRPIAPETIEAGTTLAVAVTVDNADVTTERLRFSLAGKFPSGVTIAPETGHLTWTPAVGQAPGKHDVRVSAETSDGRRDETTLRITVTAPVPLKLKAIAPQAVEAGKAVTVPVAVDNAEKWQGKLRYSLGPHFPSGSTIDAESGAFTWTPRPDQAAGNCEVTVSVQGPQGRKGETSFIVKVLRPIPPLRPISPQTVEAGKALNVTVTVENAEAWKGKLRYFVGPNVPVGSTISAETGVFTWTPPEDQEPGKHDVTVSVEGPDGQRDQNNFTITVTRPTPPLEKEIAVDIGNGVKLEMVLIPAGEFLMGSPDSDTMAAGHEKPQHRVRITKPFYLGKYLVTQEQWEAVMGSNPGNFKGPQNPVETVSWKDCRQFFDKLNAKSRPGPGKFQLPTEAQWEYACRAGGTTRYCFGDEESALREYAWYGANSGRTTHPVGAKRPNAWGLYDTHGNVWEWCADWYGPYGNSSVDDPIGPTTGSIRVYRGGSWFYPAGYCRSASRAYREPEYRFYFLGFRASLVPADKVTVDLIAPTHAAAGQPKTPDDQKPAGNSVGIQGAIRGPAAPAPSDEPPGRRLRTFQGGCAALSPVGRQVLIGGGGSSPKVAILFDAATGRRVRAFVAHQGLITSVAFSGDGRKVLTASTDGTAILWDANNATPTRTFELGNPNRKNLRYKALLSLDGRWILVGSWLFGGATIYDASTGLNAKAFNGSNRITNLSLALSPDGRMVTAGNDDAYGVLLWDVASGKSLHAFSGQRAGVFSAAFSPDCRKLVTGAGEVILWDVESGKQDTTFRTCRKLRGKTPRSVSAASLAFSADGRQIVAGWKTGDVTVWDATAGNEVRTFGEHERSVETVAFSPDGHQILTASSDATILWDAAGGSE